MEIACLVEHAGFVSLHHHLPLLSHGGLLLGLHGVFEAQRHVAVGGEHGGGEGKFGVEV